MARPRMTVTPLTLAPLAHGLLPVATEVHRPESHARFGVQYDTLSGLTGGVQTLNTATAAMTPQGSRAPEVLAEDALPLVETDPFLIYAGAQAKGVPAGQLHARARAKLALAAGRFIEAGFYPQLRGAAGVHAEAAAAVSPVVALGLLEEWLADHVGALGVVHAPVRAAAALSRAGLTDARSGKRYTALGHPIAYGAGYGNTKPDGTAAPAGTAWLYATGPVMVNRSGVEALPEGGVGPAMTLVQNLATVYATEVVSVGFEAGAVAVPVSLA